MQNIDQKENFADVSALCLNSVKHFEQSYLL